MIDPHDVRYLRPEPVAPPVVVQPRRQISGMLITSGILALVLFATTLVFGLMWNSTRGKLATSQDKVAALSHQVASLTTAKNGLTAQVADLSKNVATLNTQVTDLKATVKMGRDVAKMGNSIISHYRAGIAATSLFIGNVATMKREYGRGDAAYSGYKDLYDEFMTKSASG